LKTYDIGAAFCQADCHRLTYAFCGATNEGDFACEIEEASHAYFGSCDNDFLRRLGEQGTPDQYLFLYPHTGAEIYRKLRSSIGASCAGILSKLGTDIVSTAQYISDYSPSEMLPFFDDELGACTA
jgi:hypothetical protein